MFVNMKWVDLQAISDLTKMLSHKKTSMKNYDKVDEDKKLTSNIILH